MNTLPTTTDTGFLQRTLWNPQRQTVGVQFLVLGMAMGCLGSALALIIRFQLAWPDQQVIRPETYLSIVTMHGTLMLFFVVSPILISGFGTLLIPSMIGAHELAHPRLAQASLWLQGAACGLLLVSTQTVSLGSGSGWTAFPPLSAVEQAAPGSGSGQSLWLWAMALYLVSFLLGSFNFAKT
ncbi:MAG: cbb3-type cytochrome c oxidase subunit I, partial [Planctomycetaceae bacterium]